MTDTPQEAARLVLIRHASSAGTTPEVLLVRRYANAACVPEMYAFPGGPLDSSDTIPSALALSRTFTAAEATFRLHDVEPAFYALSLWIAALRHTFEQTGILLARYGDGRLWQADAHDICRLVQERRAMQQGRTNFPNMMHDLERALATDLLIYFAHGIMPETSSGRVSTRFFLACVPSSVSAVPDQHDGVEQFWVTPEEAIQRHGHGTLLMTTVTANILQRLRSFPSAMGALEHIRRQPVETLLP